MKRYKVFATLCFCDLVFRDLKFLCYSRGFAPRSCLHNIKGAAVKQGVVQQELGIANVNVMQTGARGEAPRVAQELEITKHQITKAQCHKNFISLQKNFWGLRLGIIFSVIVFMYCLTRHQKGIPTQLGKCKKTFKFSCDTACSTFLMW